MPAGLVQAADARPLSLEDEETIRHWLYLLTSEDDRLRLYGLVGALDAAAAAGNIPGIREVILSTPFGTPLRACLAELGGRRLDQVYARREAATPPLDARTNLFGLPGPGLRLEHRPRHVVARIGAEGQWADRRTHWTAFADLQRDGWERYVHRPRDVYWRHRRHKTIGLTRRIWADDAGDLHAELELALGRPDADLVASLCYDRAIGFSIGPERGRHSWLACYDPGEWAPSDGRSDLIVWTGCHLDEVSLTDSPLLDGTGVDTVY